MKAQGTTEQILSALVLRTTSNARLIAGQARNDVKKGRNAVSSSSSGLPRGSIPCHPRLRSGIHNVKGACGFSFDGVKAHRLQFQTYKVLVLALSVRKQFDFA